MGRVLRSPRAQRKLSWISGGVFAVGLIAFLAAFVIHNVGAHQAPFNNRPVQVSHLKPTVKADPAAFKVAREFIETAVVRKNLSTAWNLVAAPLRGGETEKQWETGNNPVVPYPAKNAKDTGMTILHSWKNSLYVSLELLPKKGSGVTKPAGFNLEVVKVKGKWVVDYFEDNFNFPIHSGFGG